MVTLGRIDNMDILTADVDRLAAFYHGVLGLPFFLPFEPGRGWAAIDLGNLTLYILAATRTEPVPRRSGPGAEGLPGLDSFAFAVDDLDRAIAALDGRVDWATAGPGTWRHPNGTWYRFRAFFDPDGNKLYVTEPHKTV
jgi:isopenicillin-N N-acyltransferase-like protein